MSCWSAREDRSGGIKGGLWRAGNQRAPTICEPNPVRRDDRDGSDINHALPPLPSPSKNANALPPRSTHESTGRLVIGDGGVVAEEGRPPRAPGVGRRLPPHRRPQARSAPSPSPCPTTPSLGHTRFRSRPPASQPTRSS
jgi:hypothetical protein